MLAAYAAATNADDPLAVLEVGDRPDPEPPDGWTTVDVRAASLNHHDLWSLRGVGLPDDRLPMILGCDAAGVDADGNEVIVHSVIATDDWRGDETLDPKRTLLSELHQGALAERVAVPRRNLVPKPEALSFEEAACLPTAWLTAYRMLFTKAGVQPGDTVLIQGAGGGVASAAIVLGAPRRPARVGDEPRRGEARAGARARRARRVRERRAAARAGRRGDRDGRRGDLEALAAVAAARRHARRLGLHQRPGPVRRAAARVLPPAEHRRLDDGHARGAGARSRGCARPPGSAPRSTACCRSAEARDGFAALAAGDVFGKIVFTP